MYNHAPEGYQCPLCNIANGLENPPPWTSQKEVIYKDALLTSFIATKGWSNNTGHVIIIPNAHFENIYDIPDEVLSAIHIFSKKVALALKEVYQCEGVSTLQHNEPAGSQEAWHYHLHVIPRFTGDQLYANVEKSILIPMEERIEKANKLRAHFNT